MPSSSSLADRVKAVQDFVSTYPTKKAAATALGLLPSQISHATNPDSATPGRLATVEAAIDREKLRRLTGEKTGKEPWDAEHDPATDTRRRPGGYHRGGAYLVRLAHGGTPFLAYDMNLHEWVPVGPSPVADVDAVAGGAAGLSSTDADAARSGRGTSPEAS